MISKAGAGKILIRITKEQREKSKYIGSFYVPRPNNPNDFTVEIAAVESINNKQDFFSPGDKVLIDYGVFTVGKHQDRTKAKSRVVQVELNGDEIYWAYDGTDGFNESEVFGRIIETSEAKQYELYKPWVLLDKPDLSNEIKSTFLIIPDNVKSKKHDRTKLFFANVIASSEEFIESGKKYLFDGYGARPIYINGEEYAVAKSKSVISSEDAIINSITEFKNL